ncbi:hypothetical protein CDV36_008506 [Fusarium kuroshium]|uniref:Uncharacterized protein n=1 Tax=Fusarium kuroshium TaxID=2010991 RepID=A0A3M2S2U8_9HYPO|nr:hypothetical protein CDV36_008506 [Fusarium kuroshium]
MADSRRIEWFLGRAGLLPPPQQIPSLVEPPSQDYEPFIKANRDAARQLLVQQRMADPSYRPPSEQKRNLFRTKHQKEEASNHSNWTFSKHEVARAFDLLLSTEPLAAAGVAQALLLYTTLTSLDELWGHLHDPRLEKRMKRNRLSSAVDCFPPGITWLDKAASHDNIDYIHLLCQSRVSQEALTRAFGISLSKSSSDAMRLLLSYGAAASSYPDAVAQHTRIGDLALVSLLLSAPTAMTTGAWLECLEKDLARAMAGTGFSLEILLLCVANRRDLVCDSLLLATLRAQSLPALAVLLAYASSNDKFFGVRESACELATLVPDSTQKLSFFTLLAEAGLVGDYPVLREELVKSVKAHHIPLAKLLVGAGVSVDIPPHNALQWAVSQMDFVMMELVKNGAFSSPVSLALSYVPEPMPEPDMIHLMDIFGPMGMSGEHLDAHLVRAVRKKHLRLVETLVRCGASVEYEQASAIQCALGAVDFSMLKVLLQRKCSPEVLSATIPAGMGISPRDSRLQAMKSILQKGVHSQVLGVPLQQVVSEDGDIDSDLIQLFLEYHAPVDLSNTADGNPLLVAARRGNPSVLQMLCTGGPRTETLSVAVPIAFKAMEKHGYDVALAMITLLLQKGANGKAVDQTLLEASLKDTRLDMVRVLVEHRANANFSSGVAYNNAVERGNFELLEILCSRCPPSPQSLHMTFYTAMKPEYYNLKTLEFLLESAPSSHILQAPANIEGVLRGHPHLAEVVPCLVRHGLNVDTGGGMLLCSAVQEKNVALLGTLVSAKPHTTSLTAAFQEATAVESRDVKLEIMKLLLEAASSAEIGQSEYLPQETKTALSGDINGLELLLSHKASVDVQGGQALQEAAEEGVPEVLKLLLDAKPTALTVEKAFIVGSSSSVASHTKAVILGYLLKTDQVSVDAVSKALTEAVSMHSDDILLAKLLLSYHANVGIDTLKMALESSPVDMFLSLSKNISEPATAKELFRHVRNSDIDSERRYIAYQSLAGKNIDADELSEALLDSIKSDPNNLDIPDLLLENGAVVNYKDGAAFTMAFESSNLNLVRALSRHLVKADESAATLAFDYVSNNASFDSEVRLEIYSCLLEFSISKESLNKALVGALESTATNTAIVSMLVEHGADPNAEEANCFVLACKKNSRDEFRALSKHADLAVVLSAILDNVKEELEVMNWLILLFEEQPAGTKVQEDELLFKCMRKFPQGTLVLGFLLDHGVPAAAKIICNLRPTWELEECTALLWAISSSLKIDNEVIIRLLQMEDAALPTYVTPQSQMSAVFLCLLDKSRTPVLKALLELAPGDMFNSTVSGSDFSKIACYPKKPKAKFQSLFEEEDEISPREAALFLGNIDAFKLLAGEGTPDDGTLHLASLLALPDFVTWLLETHDANYEEENFGFMVPLALACFSKPFPWCKIANEESEWNLRLRETMKILITKTRKTWRYREKLVLHIALENGPEVTKAMLDALDIRHEADKDKTYLYTDRTGLHYSPCEYVEEFVEAEALQKKKLVKCLTGQGLT